MDPGQVKLPTTFFPTHILPKWQAAFISGYFCTFSCKRAGDWQVILLINLCHYLLPKELGRYLTNVSPRYDCSQPEETNGVSPSFFFLPDTVAAAAMSCPLPSSLPFYLGIGYRFGGYAHVVMVVPSPYTFPYVLFNMASSSSSFLLSPNTKVDHRAMNLSRECSKWFPYLGNKKPLFYYNLPYIFHLYRI